MKHILKMEKLRRLPPLAANYGGRQVLGGERT